MAVGDTPPIQDPTTLTTAQLLRQVTAERDYVDGKIAVIEQRLDGMDEATKVLHDTVTELPTDVQEAVGHLKELTQEKFDGLEAVMDEQRRGVEVAEQEREKAAKTLRIELARSIQEGDDALKKHIEAQVAEIRAALTSSDLLERERMGRATDRVDAERRVNELNRQLGDLAISKAESATTKQFDSVVREIADLRQSVAAMTEQLAAKLS